MSDIAVPLLWYLTVLVLLRISDKSNRLSRKSWILWNGVNVAFAIPSCSSNARVSLISNGDGWWRASERSPLSVRWIFLLLILSFSFLRSSGTNKLEFEALVKERKDNLEALNDLLWVLRYLPFAAALLTSSVIDGIIESMPADFTEFVWLFGDTGERRPKCKLSSTELSEEWWECEGDEDLPKSEDFLWKEKKEVAADSWSWLLLLGWFIEWLL